ncbi:MAG: ComEC/Rec2 family competence protein, partial [Planctomycetota bacterium]|nr:ComEC/Rec2 family competence protein [Planctomycetota bacterium]
DELCLYLSPACLILAILGQWLFIDIRLMIVVAMASLAYLHQAPVMAIHPPQQQPIKVEATVYSIAKHVDYVQVTLGDLSSINSDYSDNVYPTRLRAISNDFCHELAIGERIRAQGILEKNGKWLSIKKFSYTSMNSRRWLPFQELRQLVQQKLSALYSDGELGIAKALILADKSSLDDLLQSGYRNFGLLHLLAVSGMHFWLWNFFLRRLLSYRFHRLRIPLLVLAALLAGFGPAVSRALGFIVARDLAAISQRGFSALNLIAIVGIGELMLFRNSNFGLGYLLSYTATIAIIVCSDKKNDSSLMATMRCSWAAFFATMPLIHHIQATIEFYSIILSPVFALFTTARLFIILPSMLFPSQPISQWMLSLISNIELKIINMCDMLPGTPFIATTKSGIAVTVIAIIALLLSTPHRIPARRLRIAGATTALICFSYQPSATIGISMINAGHGLGVIINGEQSSIGFDLGSKTLHRKRLVDGVYFKELQRNRWPTPKKFIFSHRDTDHVNGMPELKRRLDVTELNHGQAMSLTLPPWQIKVLRTRGGLNHTANDIGYALDLRYEQHRIIVLGDQDGSALFELAQRIEAGPVDIMFSPHHGLSTDGLAMLIEHLRPSELWASCAIENFPLPAQPIADHYGIPLLHTVEEPLRYFFSID